MPTASSTLLGRPVWYELMTSDPNAAEKFYKAVVGWTSAPFGDSPQPYTLFKRSGDKGVAGLMKIPEGMHFPPFWAMYIAVPNFEQALAHIKKLGGTELGPVIDIPNIGRMQMVKDPQGAAFYIMQPGSTEETPEGPAEIGQGSWHELMTSDPVAAMKFYSEVFGWQQSEVMDMGPEMGKYYMFNRPHGMIGGMMTKPPQLTNVPNNWGIYFLVPEINAAAERVKSNGGQVINGPMEVPGGDWVLNALDPQGAAFSLHAKKA